jgi:hypothetical protein
MKNVPDIHPLVVESVDPYGPFVAEGVGDFWKRHSVPLPESGISTMGAPGGGNFAPMR